MDQNTFVEKRLMPAGIPLVGLPVAGLGFVAEQRPKDGISAQEFHSFLQILKLHPDVPLCGLPL